MNKYTVIAGINGTGKSSLRGVLEGQGVFLGHIIDADLIAKSNSYDILKAGKQAMTIINNCLQKNISFTQETTLSGHSIKKNIVKARNQGYFISMFYVGLSSCEESICRIKNRVAKGGHDIPTKDVIRRYNNRMNALVDIIEYCDEVTFYDNENGFIKVASITNGDFNFTNGYKPLWIQEVQKLISNKI